MVRVGGGWDTLEHFIQKKDPCKLRMTGTLVGRAWSVDQNSIFLSFKFIKEQLSPRVLCGHAAMSD